MDFPFVSVFRSGLACAHQVPRPAHRVLPLPSDLRPQVPPVLAFLDYELQLPLGISDDMYSVEASVLTLNYWKRRLNPKVLAPI